MFNLKSYFLIKESNFFHFCGNYNLSEMKNIKIALLLSIAFAFISCNDKTSTNTKEKEVMEVPQLTYLALGDSYTIGESVAEKERWPIELVNRLNNDGKNITSPKIIAKTGWTTDELQKAINEENITEKYDLVSLLIGVNNQYRGVDRGYDTATYRLEFRALLEQAISFANNKAENVFVVSIPDYGVTPFVKDEDRARIAKELDIYNLINKQEALEKYVRYFDITPASKDAYGDSTLVANDNLHPSGKMYSLWVDVIEPGVKEMIP